METIQTAKSSKEIFIEDSRHENEIILNYLKEKGYGLPEEYTPRRLYKREAHFLS
jgi:hypothetical protein